LSTENATIPFTDGVGAAELPQGRQTEHADELRKVA
jgi:hypothetical protein